MGEMLFSSRAENSEKMYHQIHDCIPSILRELITLLSVSIPINLKPIQLDLNANVTIPVICKKLLGKKPYPYPDSCPELYLVVC